MMMNHEPSEASDFRRRLLGSPGERQDVEYKRSVSLGEDDEFTLKLVRHIQGMANAGGGWLIIGFDETAEGLVPDPSHSASVSGSYDPTRLSQMVNSYLARGQRILLTAYQESHPETGEQHPMVSVSGFERTPFVCRSTKDASDTGQTILEQGAVYLRRPGAETSKVGKPEDWDDLISRAVQQRRDEFLAEFRALFERMGAPGQVAEPDAEQLRGWMESNRGRAFGIEG